MVKSLAILFFCVFSSSKLSAACVGIGCSCGINTVSAVAFGTYNPVSGSPQPGSGGFSVTCSALVVGLNVSYIMSLNAGLYGSLSDRKMNRSSALLSYNLYTTSGYSAIWGDGSSGTSTVSDGYSLSLLSRTIPYTVFGRIPASQAVGAGSYTDTITISVVF